MNSLIGKKIDNLLVLELSANSYKSGSKTSYKCLCDCGNIITRSRNYLIRQNPTSVKSCGCVNDINREISAKNAIGKRYGKLLILDDYPSEKGRILLCQCDCGNIITKYKTQITSGHTKSCGCYQKEMVSSQNTKNWNGYVSQYGIELLEPSYKDKEGKWYWKCKCFCGNEFVALPAKIASGHTSSCGCKKISSKERLIKKFLDDNNVQYIQQYSIKECRFKYPLKFDFAIFENQILKSLIEFDGEQHFRPVEYFGGIESFQKTQKRDHIKNEYCKKNNIPLYRIRYDLTDDEIKNKIVNIIYP